MAAGGRDNGAPGLRPHYHPNYYAAFVIDPDGNNIEAVCHKLGGAVSYVLLKSNARAVRPARPMPRIKLRRSADLGAWKSSVEIWLALID